MAASKEKKHHRHRHHSHKSHHKKHRRHSKSKKNKEKINESPASETTAPPELNEAALLKALEGIDGILTGQDMDKEHDDDTEEEEEDRSDQGNVQETLTSCNDTKIEDTQSNLAKQIQIKIKTEKLVSDSDENKKSVSARCHLEKSQWQEVKKEKSSKHSHKRKHSSRSRSRSRSRRHRRKSRSRSYDRDKRQRRSKSRSRSRNRRRSRSRRRSDSHRRSRSRRRSDSYRRSRSSRSRSRNRSHSRSSRSRRRSRSRNRSPYSRRSSHRDRSSDEESVGHEVANPFLKMITPKQLAIESFTELCRNLSTTGDGGEPTLVFRDPFAITESEAQPEATYPPLAPSNGQPLSATPTQAVVYSLEQSFPVSSGLNHQMESSNTEDMTSSEGNADLSKSLSVSDMVVKRLLAQQQLQQNPKDSTAQKELADIELQMSRWCSKSVRPGMFTGNQELRPLSKEDHNTGIQAWVKRNMFRDLAPVLSGFGLKMLRKHGWEIGQPLGKKKIGHTEPVVFDVKTDRHGLSTPADKVPQMVPAGALLAAGKQTPSCLEGKHPVSALQELCSKKHWPMPTYDLITEAGPGHMKTFLYKVTLPTGSFQPACSSGNKKMAKAQAAIACLRALGLMNDSSDMHAAS